MTVLNQAPPSPQGTASRISSRPDGMQPRSSCAPQGRELTAMGILTAFRRRWVPALAVAIPAALLAAAAVWEFIPANYQSAAILKIDQNESRLIEGGPQRESDFHTYRESQKNYMLSRQVINAALRDPKVAECPTLKKVSHPVDWLMTKLKSDDTLSPEFLKVTLEGQHPRDLALILNSVKDAYLNQAVYMTKNAKIDELRRLEERFEEVNKKVVAAQERIDKLAENLGTGDPKTAIIQQNLIQDNLDDLSKTFREVNRLIRAEEAARASLTQQGIVPNQMNADGLMGLPIPGAPAADAAAANPTQAVQRDLMMLRMKIAQFESQLRNPNHPDVINMKRQEQQLLAILGGGTTTTGAGGTAVSRMDYLIRQRDQLTEEIKLQTDRLTDFNARTIELEAEKRKIETDIKMRDELRTTRDQREIELYAPDRITIVQDANVPEEPEVKKKTQLTIVAALAMLGTIVCGFTLFEWFSYRIGAATDISSEVGLRLVGTIPSPDKGGLLGLGIFAGKVDYDEWNRAVTESMDVVRTFLMRHIDPSRSASILIAGASANEGKTTVSCQLAASLARTGKRVAVVDCDFRRPSAHVMVDGKQGPGLSEYLRGEVTLDQIRQQTQAPGLSFFAAGQVDQRVLQLLAVDGGRSLIQQLKAKFDFVIIDTSPLLFVAEPSMIAQNADIVLLATRKDYSRVQYVLQARDSLRSLQVPLLGAIMVGADSDFQRQTYGYQQEVVRMAQG
jgi:succinoglycan biosynthesis transport protein ExoP